LKGAPSDTTVPDWEEIHARRFREAMDNDFNTPESRGSAFRSRQRSQPHRSKALTRQLRALGGLLGLLARESEGFLRAGTGDEISEAQIGALIAERNEARRAKNFRPGRRDPRRVVPEGNRLEDDSQGTTWRRV